MATFIGKKLNMSQIFTEDGLVVPVTYIDLNDIVVAGFKSVDKDGYNALIIGRGKKTNPTKPEATKYKGLGFAPEKVIEVRGDFDESLKIGDKVSLEMLNESSKVIVTGFTKGKGFQGVVKRWGFAGGPRTHGQSDRERHPGSIGMRTTPGRVFKGKKMGGRMGNDKKTVKGLKTVMFDSEKGIVAVKGSVPGNAGSYVILKVN